MASAFETGKWGTGVPPSPPPPKLLVFMGIGEICAKPLIAKGLQVKIFWNKDLEATGRSQKTV